MIKKISLGVVALVAVAGGVAGMSAFEAHVINVTAKIENALRVDTTPIDFGTVFPQEQLDRLIDVTLSQSFLDEDRVDDVKYMIRQKPKCGWVNEDGTNLYGLPTATGHVFPGKFDPDDGSTDIREQFEDYYVVCPDPGSPLRPAGSQFVLLPNLCPYLSKHELTEDRNAPTGEDLDKDVPAFHDAWVIEAGEVVWTEAIGYLSKLDLDESDTWNIDLKVPCFGDHCAQDWASFVGNINPDVNADDYVLDQNLEHKVFGCDLWIEVTGVSETPIDDITGPTGP